MTWAVSRAAGHRYMRIFTAIVIIRAHFLGESPSGDSIVFDYDIPERATDFHPLAPGEVRAVRRHECRKRPVCEFDGGRGSIFHLRMVGQHSSMRGDTDRLAKKPA
jgi:hypothetical protein